MVKLNVEIWQRELRTKNFWIIMAISLPIAIGSVYGQTNSNYSYLQIPMAVMVMGTIPAMASTVLSVRIALIMIWIHKNGINFQNKKDVTYLTDEKYVEKKSYMNYAINNIWYSIGITFIILRIFGGETLDQQQLTVITMLSIFLGIIFASGINFAIFLIKNKAIYCENKKDGSRVNVGNDLKRIINFGLAPIQIIFFTYAIIMENNYISFFITLGITSLICFIASLTSYFLLKKHYMNRLYLKFDDKLKL